MIKLIIKDGDDEVKNKRAINKILVMTAFYVLYKVTMQHDKDINNLKKIIKEMKSKGE